MAGHDHTPEIHEHTDSWHHHEAAEGLPQHEHTAKADAGALVKWFFGIVVLLAIILVALGMYFSSYTTRLRERTVETQELAATAKTTLAAAEAKLGTDGKPFKYTAGDKKARTIQIPIDTAIKRTVEKYQKTTPSN